MADTGFVYFIDSDGGAVKVGYSTNPLDRLATLQATTHNRLAMRGYFPGTLRDEHAAHQRLAAVRVRGEWFRAGPEVDALFREIGAPRIPPPLDINACLRGVLRDDSARVWRAIDALTQVVPICATRDAGALAAVHDTHRRRRALAERIRVMHDAADQLGPDLRGMEPP